MIDNNQKPTSKFNSKSKDKWTIKSLRDKKGYE